MQEGHSQPLHPLLREDPGPRQPLKGVGNWWHLLLSPLHPVLGPVLRASFCQFPRRAAPSCFSRPTSVPPRTTSSLDSPHFTSHALDLSSAASLVQKYGFFFLMPHKVISSLNTSSHLRSQPPTSGRPLPLSSRRFEYQILRGLCALVCFFALYCKPPYTDQCYRTVMRRPRCRRRGRP